MSLKLRFRRGRQNGIYLPDAVPNRDFKGEVAVKMKRTVANTAGGWEYLSGRTYFVQPEVADEWIIKDYAEGKLSREYTNDERLALLATMQTIRLGGN